MRMLSSVLVAVHVAEDGVITSASKIWGTVTTLRRLRDRSGADFQPWRSRLGRHVLGGPFHAASLVAPVARRNGDGSRARSRSHRMLVRGVLLLHAARTGRRSAPGRHGRRDAGRGRQRARLLRCDRAIVGVWAPWSGSWVAGIGTQDREGGAELSTDMSFRIADVTRLMTCDVLYALADRDVVELRRQRRRLRLGRRRHARRRHHPPRSVQRHQWRGILRGNCEVGLAEHS